MSSEQPQLIKVYKFQQQVLYFTLSRQNPYSIALSLTPIPLYHLLPNIAISREIANQLLKRSDNGKRLYNLHLQAIFVGKKEA